MHLHMYFFVDRPFLTVYKSCIIQPWEQKMPTIEQIRAARALLDWSQSDLADQAGLSQTGIARIENGTNKPNTQTLEKISAAFENANIEFLGSSGVRKMPEGAVDIYNGHEGFVEFLVDVYETLKLAANDREVVVNNVNENEFLRWEKDYAKTHQERMENIQAQYKIIVEEGDQNLIASKYAEYRCIPKTVFSPLSYYIYGNKAALIDFQKDSVTVFVINSKSVSNFYREEFKRIWSKAKTAE